MSLSSIQQMFPIALSEEEARQVYSNFVNRYRTAYLRCVEQLELLSEPVLDPGNGSPARWTAWSSPPRGKHAVQAGHRQAPGSSTPPEKETEPSC